MLQPLTRDRWLTLFACLFFSSFVFGQTTPNLRTISIENDNNFEGYDLLTIKDEHVFVLAEHWHNIRTVPKATLKLLRYLHQKANVRILAIEQGRSAAYLVNKYLVTGDTLVLRQIVRNTMFWGMENYTFFQDLYAFNQALSKSERIFVRSVDIEYKMESAILVINELIINKEVPESLGQTVGIFRELFEDSRTHREQFDALAVMYYYNRDFVTQLVKKTLDDMETRPEAYQEFFGSDFELFAMMIRDMDAGLYFDYTNPNTNYKFRDNIIYDKFGELLDEHRQTGILCVIGLRHATKPSSLYKLSSESDSPISGKMMNIRISALHLKMFKTADLRRVNFAFPKLLRNNDATLIKHDPKDPTLKTSKSFDYTLFLNDNESLTPFENRLVEGY